MDTDRVVARVTFNPDKLERGSAAMRSILTAGRYQAARGRARTGSSARRPAGDEMMIRRVN